MLTNTHIPNCGRESLVCPTITTWCSNISSVQVWLPESILGFFTLREPESWMVPREYRKRL